MVQPTRHIILFDGTWNTPASDTNINRIKECVIQYPTDGWRQKTSYEDGVGSDESEKYSGGIFGKYLTKKVLSQYKYLVDNYNDGDEIYVFGFSRGAFAAQAFVGFCYWCGVVCGDYAIKIEELF